VLQRLGYTCKGHRPCKLVAQQLVCSGPDAAYVAVCRAYHTGEEVSRLGRPLEGEDVAGRGKGAGQGLRTLVADVLDPHGQWYAASLRYWAGMGAALQEPRLRRYVRGRLAAQEAGGWGLQDLDLGHEGHVAWLGHCFKQLHGGGWRVWCVGC
jgi:hypothetical protein